jgi:REP-associated tyrosine transposase
MIRPSPRESGTAPQPRRVKSLSVRDRLYVHIVWTTRDREATIDLAVARFLARFLPAVARQERAGVHALGMVRTHVHLLLQLHPTTSIPRLMQRLKGGSSVLANREGHAGQRPLRWSRGYNIVSISPRALNAVRTYVLNQARHHPGEAIAGWSAALDHRDSTERSLESDLSHVPSRDR